MDLLKELKYDKIKINWNKKPILMETFLSFLTIPVEKSTEHLGSSTGWTRFFNKEYKLEIGGGIVDKHYLDSLQYGTKLQNQYNNYVNPFYLFEILTSEGKAFFLDYYKEDIEKIISEQTEKIQRVERQLINEKDKLGEELFVDEILFKNLLSTVAKQRLKFKEKGCPIQ